MATYKVIQDIEAEDKFVGPLTLKQFVFAMFGALFAYLSFIMLSKHVLFGLAITLPAMFFGFFMAFPWSSQQPTDVWVLAKIRFRMKPKKRIWDQAGLQELVTITAPKKEERPRGNGLSETEVRSRLKALSETLDSRGWVIKNAALPGQGRDSGEDSDRLISVETVPLPQEPEAANLPDMLQTNSQGLDNMIKESEDEHMSAIYDKLEEIRSSPQSDKPSRPEPVVSPPLERAQDESTLSEMLKKQKQAGGLDRGNMHSIPVSTPPVVPTTSNAVPAVAAKDNQKTGVEKAQASMTEQSLPDILKLAHNNDLNVATIARQAKNDKDDEDKEVVISLH